MAQKRSNHSGTQKPINLRRHEQNCSICSHSDREEIERDFIEWQSPARIAEEYGIATRTAIYRHGRALDLFAKRDRNIRAALARFIEKAGEVEPTAPAIVAAIQAYAKINSQGHWIDRSEHLNLNELFDRMSQDELERYAKEGKLPEWFTQILPATLNHGQETVSD